MRMDIVARAREFALRAHDGHVRSDGSTLYIQHVEEVAELVEKSGGAVEEIAAAYLHDTVEDTQTTVEDIEKEFGGAVAKVVEGLTDFPEWTSLSLGERKAKQAERLVQESRSVKRVKLADQTWNVQIVGFGNEKFTLDDKQVYLERAKQIAEVCKNVSPYLDALFEERYEKALQNLIILREQ